MSNIESKGQSDLIAELERRLAAVTAERDLLAKQLKGAQDAAREAERRAVTAETELKLLRAQERPPDGPETEDQQAPEEAKKILPQPPIYDPESSENRLAQIWRWFWVTHDRDAK